MKKIRQKETRAKAKAEAKAAPNACSALRLGSHTTVDPKAKAAPKRFAGPKPETDQRKCVVCGVWDHWRGFRPNWLQVHKEEFFGDDPDIWEVTHTCIPCVAKEPKYAGKTIEEVREEILGIPMSQKKHRGESYKNSIVNARENVEMRDASSTQIRKFARCHIVALFEPLGEYIIRKSKAMQAVYRDVEEHALLVKMLAKSKTFSEEQDILSRMEQLEKDDKYLAFASKIDQHSWIMASSFSDSWTEIRGRDGQVQGGICSYYPCLGQTRDIERPGGVWVKAACARVLASKRWNRLHADELAAGQRYYCDCGKKHQAGWGQLVEIKRMNERGVLEMFHMRAEVPPWDVEDVRAMYIEDTIKADNAHDLFNKIRTVEPTTCELVVPDPTLPGVVMLRSQAAYEALPWWSWWEIFTMVGVEPPKWAKKPASLL